VIESSVTGATGFVGSHILDSLHARNIPTVVLLRPASDRRFISSRQASVETRTGSILEPDSLAKSLEGVSHVIHCAGCTKAARYAEYYEVNHGGTRNVVEAVNRHASSIQRLIHLSSLAVTGPAVPPHPAREDSPLRPISEYGKSKLAGECEVRDHCRVSYTILRPPAVYGPRDTAFLPMYRAVKNHLLPRPSRDQALSLVFVRDLAEAVVACLDLPSISMKTYFVASREVVTSRGIADEIANQMKAWTVPCPLPAPLLWLVCLTQEVCSRAFGRATLLNLQKFAELRAPGWVCDASLLEQETGVKCATRLSIGIAETLAWYRQEHWV
jgi:nucleoside-diphosphate-sugar epimerase